MRHRPVGAGRPGVGGKMIDKLTTIFRAAHGRDPSVAELECMALGWDAARDIIVAARQLCDWENDHPPPHGVLRGDVSDLRDRLGEIPRAEP